MENISYLSPDIQLEIHNNLVFEYCSNTQENFPLGMLHLQLGVPHPFPVNLFLLIQVFNYAKVGFI